MVDEANTRRQDTDGRTRKPWLASLPGGLRPTWSEISAKQSEAGLAKYEHRHGPARARCGTCDELRTAPSFLRHEEGGLILRKCASCRGGQESRPARPQPALPVPSETLHYSVDTLLHYLRHDSRRDPRLDRTRKVERDTGSFPVRDRRIVDAILWDRESRHRVPAGTQEAIRLERNRSRLPPPK